MAPLSCHRAILLVLLLAGCTDPSITPTDDDIGDDDSGDDAPECEVASDCPEFSYCDGGICYPSDPPEDECYEGEDECPFGEACDDGTCRAADTIALCSDIEVQVSETIPVGSGSASAFATGDVDDDGIDELVIVDGGLLTYEPLTDVVLASPVVITAGTSRQMTIMHSDADGLLDVAISIPDANHVQIFHGDGVGGFGDERIRMISGPVWNATHLRNATGVDALMVELHGDDVSEIQRLIFADEDAVDPIQTFDGVFVDVDVADLDGDAIDELLVLDDGQLHIWAANPNEASLVLASSHEATLQPHDERCESIVAGDISQDGIAELFCLAGAKEQTVALGIWRGLQGGGYQIEDALFLAHGGDGVVLADLYGDGPDELLLDDGRFVRLDSLCLGQTGYMEASPILAADIDGDGRDGVIRWSDPNTLVVLAIDQ